MLKYYMSVKRNIELINELLNRVDPVQDSVDTRKNLIYRMGYLIGFLAKLANDDSYVRARIMQVIKRIDEEKRK